MIKEEPDNNNYFPELENIPIKHEDKYGINNVGLVKTNRVVTGCQWNYNYLDTEDMKIRYIHSYDLRKLREKVLSMGFEWIITDNRKAIDAYKLNNELMEKHKSHPKKSVYRGSSGVLHVSKHFDRRYGNKYWRYLHNGQSLSDKSLKVLRDRVKTAGLEWIVRDKELYEHNLKVEPFIK